MLTNLLILVALASVLVAVLAWHRSRSLYDNGLEFPDPVAKSDARWLLRPHGTCVLRGEIVSVPIANGKNQRVMVDAVSRLAVEGNTVLMDRRPISEDLAAQIALDSGISLQALLAMLRGEVQDVKPYTIQVVSFSPVRSFRLARPALQ